MYNVCTSDGVYIYVCTMCALVMEQVSHHVQELLVKQAGVVDGADV